MGNRPRDRKREQAYEDILDDQGGGIFGDTFDDLPVEEQDPIYEMRKYTIHFRMMVLLPEFKMLRPGLTLTFGSPKSKTAKAYKHGIIGDDAQILVDGELCSTLTAFATHVIPDSWYKTEKSGKKAPSRPDGWNRVYVTYPDLGYDRVEDVLFKHHKDLGYSVEELSNLEYIYSEMERRGYGKQISDLGSDLKAWRTSQGKSDKKNETDREPEVGENGTLF